jgi:hypothetical protein
MREWHEETEESAPDFISRRVLGLLKERKAKLAPFARGLGIDPALFRRFLKGKRRWRMDCLEKVAEGLEMSLEELFTGPKPQPEVLQPIITVVGEYSKPPEGLMIDEYFAVPLVEGPIAAGHSGAIPGDYVTSMVWVYKPEIGRRQHHNLRAVKSLSVNKTNFSPADNGCCQMMQSDITGIGFLKANQKLAKPVEP